MPEDRAGLVDRFRAERSGSVGHVLLTQRILADVMAGTAAWAQRGLDENEWVLVIGPSSDWARCPVLRRQPAAQ